MLFTKQQNSFRMNHSFIGPVLFPSLNNLCDDFNLASEGMWKIKQGYYLNAIQQWNMS